MSSRLLAILLVLSLALVSVPDTTTATPTFVAQEIGWLAAARDAQGRLWAAWEASSGSDAEVYYSRWAGGAWSPPEPVHARPDTWDRSPSLAIAAAPAGQEAQAWLAWTSSPRSDPSRRELYVSRWAAGAWTEPQAVPTGAATRVSNPVLAAAADGVMWLAWSGLDGADTDIYASRWDGQSWSAPLQVSGEPARDDSQPHMVVAGDGRPWLVWTGYQSGPDDDIYASHWTGAGWTVEQMVNHDDDGLDTRPSLALGPDGQPWLAWMGSVDGGERPQLRILFARWDPSRSAWTPEQIASSSPGLAVDERAPTLAVDGQGQMHLAWGAAANGATALAHARWTGAAWAEPQAIRTGVTADVLAVESGDGQPVLLWLDLAASPAPVAQATVEATAQPLSAWIDSQPAPAAVLVDPIPNRYVAFGDSITWGEYNEHAWTPYPVRLDTKLDSTVRPSEVLNFGEPGERTNVGAATDRRRGREQPALVRSDHGRHQRRLYPQGAGRGLLLLRRHDLQRPPCRSDRHQIGAGNPHPPHGRPEPRDARHERAGGHPCGQRPRISPCAISTRPLKLMETGPSCSGMMCIPTVRACSSCPTRGIPVSWIFSARYTRTSRRRRRHLAASRPRPSALAAFRSVGRASTTRAAPAWPTLTCRPRSTPAGGPIG